MKSLDPQPTNVSHESIGENKVIEFDRDLSSIEAKLSQYPASDTILHHIQHWLNKNKLTLKTLCEFDHEDLRDTVKEWNLKSDHISSPVLRGLVTSAIKELRQKYNTKGKSSNNKADSNPNSYNVDAGPDQECKNVDIAINLQ